MTRLIQESIGSKGWGLLRSGRRFFHRGTGADRGVLKQIFKKKDYALEGFHRGREIKECYEIALQHTKRPLIVDAGANIGASLVWFANDFPEAHIAAFEPSEENFKVLQMNSFDIRCELHRCAVSSANGFVDLIDPGQGEWAYQTQVRPDGAIASIGLDWFIRSKEAEGFSPLIVKIDIEGAESELFSQNTSWIKSIPLIIIELHDWLLPKKGTAKNFLLAISKEDRDFVYWRENVFSFKN